MRAIRRLPNLLSAYIQVTSTLMNALVHFVHWTIPLFLFLAAIPHGKDINHLNLPPFSIISPTSRRWDHLARWSILTFYSFAFWSYAFHTCVPPCFFSSVFFQKRPFRQPLKFRQIPLYSRAYSFSPPSLSDSRAPTEASSIFHLPRSRFVNERLLFWVCFKVFPHHLSAIFKCLPHFGKESSLFVPSFPFFAAFPRPSFCRIPTTTCQVPLGYLLYVHRCILREF